jgi:KUP system potassium uptake protein
MNQTAKKNIGMFALLGLCLGALGVVYGDIGTSPLYAVNEIFFGHGNTVPTVHNIYGAISLVVWILTLIITIKYVTFVLRADADGEGGVFALFHLLEQSKVKKRIMLGILILAAGLLFGEGIITPSISVLSAVEGLKIINPGFDTFIIPITLIILTLLFLLQSRGTHQIGKIFGPVMMVWFIVIGYLGVVQVWLHPQILYAFNPFEGIRFIYSIGIFKTMAVLGSVVLVITGGEALFADIGHFGIKPVRISWLAIVFPALILNYLGQGAFLLGRLGSEPVNIFFGMVPAQLLYPMVILATFATIIASQALITGVFSLFAQGMQIGLLPRLRIKHTNSKQGGQIYISTVNWVLYAACVELVLVFKSSTALAAAYGLAVSGVMLSTSLAMIFISTERWGWRKIYAYLFFGGFALIDSTFLFCNSLKFLQGGYIPLFLGILMFIVMNIWLWGRGLVLMANAEYTENRRLDWFLGLKKRLTDSNGHLQDVGATHHRLLVETDRVMVFMVSEPVREPQDRIPVALRIYMKRNGALPKHIIFLNISYSKTPYLQDKKRFDIKHLGSQVFSINGKFGFMEQPNVRQVLRLLNPEKIIKPDLEKSVIIVGREQFTIEPGAPWWIRVKAAIFKATLKMGLRTNKYFGLYTEDGLFEVEVPVRIGKNGATIKHPEFDLSYGASSQTNE